MSRHSAGVGGSLSTRTTSASTAWASDSDSSSTDSSSEDAFLPSSRRASASSSSGREGRALRRSRIIPVRAELLRSDTHRTSLIRAPSSRTTTLPSRSFAPDVPSTVAQRAAFHSRPYSTGRDKSPNTSLLAAHLRAHWPSYAALVAGSVTLGAWYFTPPGPSGGSSLSRSLSTAAPAQFAVRRSSADGGGYKIVTALAADQVDDALRLHERSTRIDRPSSACRVARFDTNSVASNSPCEDKRAEVIVERDWPAAGTAQANGTKGDLCFFAVMDGHAGNATSTLLAQKLIPFVALELDKLFRQQGEYTQMAATRTGTGAGAEGQGSKSWTSALSLGGLLGAKQASSTRPGRTDAASPHKSLDADPTLVEAALRKAFANLDKEICSTPVELLHEYELMLAALPNAKSAPQPDRIVSVSSSVSSLSPSEVATGQGLKGFANLFGGASTPSGPNLAERQKAAYAALRPAMNGSCALLTYIDSARGDVYVACTGDSRAIGGFWNPSTHTWAFEPLSTDQTGRNPSEVARMRSEHPPQEADQVIMRGRVLGGLEPTRAFGDAVYKWDRSLQERLYDAFVPGGVAGARRIPRLLRTPPYVTSDPLVQVRHLSPHRPTGPAGSANTTEPDEKQLRFIVMATDGLWDMLANEEVGALVAGHLAGLKGDVKAEVLLAHVLGGADTRTALSRVSGTQFGYPSAPTSQPSSSSPPPSPPKEGSNPLSSPSRGEQTFTFTDDNLSTHLIRNAFGGAHRERVASLLAIPSPESRRYRDDITVNVILLHGSEPDAQDAPLPNSAAADHQPTSKL